MASAIGRQLVQGRSKAFLNVFLKIENLSGSHFLSTSGGPVCQGSDNQQRVPLTKRSLMAKRTAHDNPFDTYTLRPDATEGESLKEPILVPSVHEKRLVGCCCEDDYDQIVWFELEKGSPKKCECGYYFQLIDYDPLDPTVTPRFGEGFGSGLSKMY